MKFRLVWCKSGYRKRLYTITAGEEISIKELAEITGLSLNAARIRLNECTKREDLFREPKVQKTGRHYEEVEKNKLDNDPMFCLALRYI